MGKIVLVEPHKVLQQAIALSLFPEHEVQVEETVSASGIAALQGIDLLIVDAAALRDSDRLSPEIARAIQSSPIPTVWIDEDEAARAPKRDKLAVVIKPIESAGFQSVLASLLSPSSPRKERKKAPVSGEQKAERDRGAGKKGRVEAGEQSAFQFIDLVDVVEEEPPPPEKRKSPRKPK